MNEANNLIEQRAATPLLLAGPVTWFVSFALVYLITAAGCIVEYTSTISGRNTLRLLIVSITLIAAILAAWSAFTAISKWQTLHRTIVPASMLTLRQRQESLYIASFILSLVSLVVILGLALVTIRHPVC